MSNFPRTYTCGLSLEHITNLFEAKRTNASINIVIMIMINGMTLKDIKKVLVDGYSYDCDTKYWLHSDFSEFCQVIGWFHAEPSISIPHNYINLLITGVEQASKHINTYTFFVTDNSLDNHLFCTCLVINLKKGDVNF